MKILFLIGNGFDLNLGMNTKYSDFYKYYVSIKSDSDAINKLKKEISKNIINWSDLEFELGKYTKKIKLDEDFFEIYDDLTDTLATYLEKEENRINFSKINREKFFKYLSHPEDFLPIADKVALNNFKGTWYGKSWIINIITFNYTQSLEKIMKYEDKRININHEQSPISLQKIEHIHGYIDRRMVLGVNDISQVSNNTFHDNQNVLGDLIKSNCNKAQKHMVDIWCQEQIKKANLIYVFGSSIGATDKIWWNLIGAQLKRSDFRLVIFHRGKKISPRRPQRKLIEETKMKNDFFAQTKLKDAEKKEFVSKIFVASNTNMFDLK